MANYTKTTDFAAKDTLPGGDTNKVVRGSEFETEFDAISTAIATKSDIAGPTFTGTVTIPTVDINAGAIDGTTIGASSAAAGTFTNLVATSADINGGTVDGATIGGSSAGAGTFTNLTASGTVNFNGATISNLGTITTANLDGGTADNIVIGGSTPAAGTFTSVVATTADINGGTADNVVIGGSTAAAGTFTTLAASSLSVGGSSVLTSVAFSDLQAGAVTLSSETFSDVDNQIPTNAAVIDYVAATIPLISEVNDLSANVTWANVPDANITQSSVTQHQAALAIAATQITSLTSTVTELNLVDGSTADTVVNSKAVIYGAAGQITANELDVDNIQIDANAVKSTDTNGNIQLFPNGTGFTELYGNTNAGAIRFNCESNSHGVTLKGPPHSASATYSLELPDADGTNGQVLQTNGSGKLSFVNTAGGAVFEATADGAIANGDKLIITSDGKLKKAGETQQTVPSVNSSTAVTGITDVANATGYEQEGGDVTCFYDPNKNWHVVFAADDDNIDGLMIQMGVAASGGASVTWRSSDIATGDYNIRSPKALYHPTTNNWVVIFKEKSNNTGIKLKAITPGTNYTDSVTQGTTYELQSSRSENCYLIYDSDQDAFVAIYQDFNDNEKFMAKVFTVAADRTITFGSEQTISTNRTGTYGGYYDSNDQRVVVLYTDFSSSSHGRARTLDVTGGSTRSFTTGTILTYHSGSTERPSACFDPDANKGVVAYQDGSDGNKGKCIVLTSSSGTLSASGEQVFHSTTGGVYEKQIIYNTTTDAYCIVYRGHDGSNLKTYAIYATISGTTLTFSTALKIDDNLNSGAAAVLFDEDEPVMSAFYAGGSGGDNLINATLNDTKAVSNVTAENYVGIADAAYSDGNTATCQTVGSVDDAQSSLTPGQLYYLQTDGTLGTSADSPSVVAGVAVASTKLLVTRS